MSWFSGSTGAYQQSGWTTVRKASDETVTNSTTLQNDDELFFTAANGTVYEIEAIIIYTCASATPDLKVSFGEDATSRGGMFGHTTFSTADAAQNTGALTSQSNALSFGTSATLARAIKFSGTHVGGGGTFRLQFAQNTLDATNGVTVKAGSLFRYRTIS